MQSLQRIVSGGLDARALFSVLVFLSTFIHFKVSAKDDLSFNTSLQTGINLVSEDNLFWNLSETFAPDVDYSTHTTYLEGYFKPSTSFTYLQNDALWYGKGSFVFSYTAGTDPYDAGDNGEMTLEEAYLGYRVNMRDDVSVDISLGARELKLGSGMLISNGGVSGFERGALKLGPRKAWEKSALLNVKSGEWNTLAYYIDPNELDSNNTDTRIYGFDVNTPLLSQDSVVGLTYGHVIRSGAPYPIAPQNGEGPPQILQNGRDNLSFINHYGKVTISSTETARYFAEWDGAYQWNDNINQRAWGGRIKLGVTLPKKRWSPTFTYSWQTFSGDDPFTDDIERFDPLYYEGSPSSWSTGSKSSMVFINSNVQAHHLAVNFTPSEKHILTLRAAHIRVNELGSPVQFGQAARVDFSDGLSTVITGVTDSHLADDVFIEYTYLMSRHVFISLGFAVSFPGDGIDAAISSSGESANAPSWPGGYANVIIYL